MQEEAKKPSARGGARPGAGRKRVLEDGRPARYYTDTKTSAALADIMKTQGIDNESSAVRWAIKFAWVNLGPGAK